MKQALATICFVTERGSVYEYLADGNRLRLKKSVVNNPTEITNEQRMVLFIESTDMGKIHREFFWQGKDNLRILHGFERDGKFVEATQACQFPDRAKAVVAIQDRNTQTILQTYPAKHQPDKGLVAVQVGATGISPKNIIEALVPEIAPASQPAAAAAQAPKPKAATGFIALHRVIAVPAA